MTSTKEKVIRYIDEKKEEIIDFLCQFIGFKSINPGIPGKGKELEAQNWVRDQFKKLGFDKVDYWAVDPEKRRPNVVGIVKGKGKGKSLIFNGHCDVVPVTEKELKRWTVDPWRATTKKGFVYGRGASDVKGGLTSMIWATKALIDSGISLKGDLYIESVVGEESQEGETIGTKATVDRGYRAPFAVVCEPTNCEIHVKSPGVFFFELIIPGKEAHTSARNQVIFPQRYGILCGKEVGVDAIAKAVPFIELFQKLETQWNQRWRDKILGGGGYPDPIDQQGIGLFTMNPSFIEGGTYLGSVPGYCKITYCVWYPSWLKDEDIWKELKEHVQALASTDDWLRENPPEFNVPVLQRWRPMKEVAIDHPGVKNLSAAYEKVSGKKAVITGFKAVADPTFLSEEGIPTVLFGPGSLGSGIHGPDEHVPIDQVIKCTKTLAIMAMNWCS